MLSVLRSATKNLITKVLLALLALTFVIWGFGDILRSMSGDIALRVGDRSYSASELQKFYDAQYQMVGAKNGKPNSAKEKMMQDLFLYQLINSELINQEAKRLGIEIGDHLVQYEIVNNIKSFRKDGKFDKELLMDFLDRSKIPQSVFVEDIRRGIAKKALIDAMTSHSVSSEMLLKQIVRALHSKRHIKIFKPIVGAVLEEPDTEQLKEVLKSHENLFLVPETRKVSYLELNIKSFIELDAKVEHQKIDKFYQDNLYLFEMPEKRDLFKWVFQDQREAEIARVQLIQGVKDKKLSQSLKKNKVILKAIDTNKLDEEASKTVFNLKKDELSEVLKTQEGWCIFQITAIAPKFVQPISDVKEEINNQILEQIRHEKYTHILNSINEEINANKSLEEIAKKYNLKIKQATLSANRHYQPSNSIENNNNFIEVAFATPLNVMSQITSSIPGLENFILRVDALEAEHVMPFDSIKRELHEAWVKEQKAQKELKMLENLKEFLLNSPESQISEDFQSSTITIGLQGERLFGSQELIEIFTTPVSNITGIMEDSHGNKVIVKVLSYLEPSEAVINKEMANEAIRLDSLLQDLFLMDYLLQLHQMHKVEFVDVAYTGAGQI